jgi:hypothetical protein
LEFGALIQRVNAMPESKNVKCPLSIMEILEQDFISAQTYKVAFEGFDN